MDIVTEKVELAVADGTRMAAFVARPDDRDTHPGLIVVQEAFGVNNHIRAVTRRFAEAGYVAISPDMFHRTAPGFESGYQDIGPALKEMQAMTESGMDQDLKAAYDWLRGQSGVVADRVGAIGYCMGGRAAFLANSALPLKAAVSYYGGGIAQTLLGRAGQLSGPMLLFWGGRDQHISVADTRAIADALRAAKKPFVDVMFSSADHGFFCDERASYDAAAASQAWALTQAFFRSHLG